MPPTRWSPSVTKHCTVVSDLTSLDKNAAFEKRRRRFRKYYVANYELAMNVRNNNLTIWLEYGGQRYGVANVDFES